MNVVVTSGTAYSDIDAFACAIALAEAMTQQGQNARAWLPGPPNLTVPSEFCRHSAFYGRCPTPVNEVVLVDLSDPAHIPDCFRVDQVTAVFDHHFGFETYWAATTAQAQIEPVGAAATLIWEEIVKRELQGRIFPKTLYALACAIVSNTAGFRLPLTTSRDRYALEHLERILFLNAKWREPFLLKIDEEIFANLSRALKTDTKISNLGDGTRISVGQIEVHSRTRAIKALGEIADLSAGLPDILIVAARGSGRTSLITSQRELAFRIAAYFDVSVENHGTLNECRFQNFCLRKMILPDINRV